MLLSLFLCRTKVYYLLLICHVVTLVREGQWGFYPRLDIPTLTVMQQRAMTNWTKHLFMKLCYLASMLLKLFVSSYLIDNTIQILPTEIWKYTISWFRLSRSALIFECLPFGLKDRGLLILLLPDVSPASTAGIFRGLAPGLASEQQPRSQVLWRCRLQTQAKRGRRSVSRPRSLSPKGKH